VRHETEPSLKQNILQATANTAFHSHIAEIENELT
jgi:hypothetical protein